MRPSKANQDAWLAEAIRALADAERMTGLFALTRPRNDLELASLQGEIMTLRRRIERLQRERAGELQAKFHPDWMEYSVWHAPKP